jgi:hypothetical protein
VITLYVPEPIHEAQAIVDALVKILNEPRDNAAAKRQGKATFTTAHKRPPTGKRAPWKSSRPLPPPPPSITVKSSILDPHFDTPPAYHDPESEARNLLIQAGNRRKRHYFRPANPFQSETSAIGEA